MRDIGRQVLVQLTGQGKEVELPHAGILLAIDLAPSDTARLDLALGRLVEAISKSRYWKESAIFVLEDDAQNGPDHVDAHRSPAFVVSPFVKRGSTVSTLYTTSGMLRTIELILGLPPMNQFDATATSMGDCFTNIPDLRPFTALANNIPLEQLIEVQRHSRAGGNPSPTGPRVPRITASRAGLVSFQRPAATAAA